MAIGFKSSGAGAGFEISGVPLNLVCPATVDANDILTAHVMHTGITTNPTTPSGWSLLYPDPADITVGAPIGTGTATARHWAFGKLAVGDEDGTTVSFGSGGGSNGRAGRIYSFAGYVSGTITDVVPFASFTDGPTETDPPGPSVTTTVAGAMAVALMAQDDNNTHTGITGESGGTWGDYLEFVDSLLGPQGLAMAFNACTPTADPGTVSGGTLAGANDESGTIGFEIRPNALSAETPITIAATSTFDPSLTRQSVAQRALAVASTFTAVVSSFALRFKTFAVNSTFVPSMQRGYPRALAVSSPFTVVIQKARSIALAIASPFSATLSRAVVYLRALAVSSPSAAALSGLALRLKTLSVASTFTAAMTVGRAYARTLSVSSTMTAAMARARGLLIAAASPFTTSIARGAFYFRSLAASSSFAPAIRKGLARVLAVVATFAPVLIKGRLTLKTLAVASAMSAGMTRARGLLMAVASAFTASVSRRAFYLRALDTSSNFVPTIRKGLARILAVASTFTSTLVKGRLTLKTLAAGSGFTAALSRRLGIVRSLSVASLFDVAVIKRQFLSVQMAVASSFDSALSVGRSIALAASSVFSAILTKILTVAGESGKALDGHPLAAPSLIGVLSMSATLEGRARVGPSLDGVIRITPRAA